MRKFILVSLFTCFLFSCEKTMPKNAASKWCTDAHSDLEKLMTALKETVPRGEKESIKVPEKVGYLKQCMLLPENAQKCLVVSFAQQNTKVCQALNLRGADKTNFEKLISGK